MRPPALARRLLARAVPPHMRDSFLDDLDEVFERIARERGLHRARRWYWRQVLAAAPTIARGRANTSTATTEATMFTHHAFTQQLVSAWRTIRRSPRPVVGVVLAMSLGIGASTAVVTVAEGVIGRRLPFTQPGELLQMQTIVEKYGEAPETNFQDARDIRTRARTLAAIGLYDLEDAGVRTSEDSVAIPAVVVSADLDLQRVLDLRPVLGRLFADDDMALGSAPVAVVSSRFWRSALGRDPGAVGHSLWIGSRRFTIIGVLPASADRFPAGGSDVWAPLVFPASSFLNNRGSMALTAIARMAPDASIAAVQAELASISTSLASEHPDTNAGRRSTAGALQDAMSGPVRPMLLLLGGATAILLLVACANIGNLLLAQSVSRQREFDVRAALGATRRDLAWQLGWETLLLCGVSGVIGVAAAPLLTRLFIGLYPETLPLVADAVLDARVAGAAVALTLAAALMAGLPRLRNLRVGSSALASSRGTIGPRSPRLSSALTAVQSLLSIVLLSASLLLLGAFASVRNANPGFEAHDLVTVRVSLPAQTSPERMAVLQDQIRAAAAAVPGVTNAAHTMFIPFTPGSWGDGYRPVGVADAPARPPIGHFYMVSPDYLETMKIPLLSGRGLTSRDDIGSPRVIVVSREFARGVFGTESVLGRKIFWNDDTWEIVGTAADIKHESPWQAPDRDVYVPRRQVIRGSTWLLARTALSPSVFAAGLQTIMKQQNLAGTVTAARTMQDHIDVLGAPARFRAALAAALAALALCLTAVGVFSVASFSAAERAREFGVRLALGAQPQSIVRHAIVRSSRAVAAGLVPGLAVSLFLYRWMSLWLEGLTSTRTIFIVAAAALFAALTAVAAWLPARRASRIDPLTSMRAE